MVKRMCATGARRGEAKTPSLRSQNPLSAWEDPAPPTGKRPSGGGNAPLPDENGLRAVNETASGGSAEISMDGENL
jgi:hypothetical protein